MESNSINKVSGAHDQNEKELNSEIEKLRSELNSMGETVGLDNENIIRLSQQLDGFINQRMQLRKNKGIGCANNRS